jgi:ribonuclease HI
MTGIDAWKLYFDGACEPVNPGGIATYGWCLYNNIGSLIKSDCGIAAVGNGSTNNVAEYAGLEAGLQYLAEQKMQVVLLCLGDSKLVVEQVAGRWRCNKVHLQEARDRVRALLEKVAHPWNLGSSG